MTETEALDALSLMVLSEEEPELSLQQLNELVARARRPDASGRTYEDANWEPTWDLDFAAAEGWRRKAGMAAARFNFSEDGQTFQRAQVYAHCISQAEMYARKGMGAIPAGGASTAS